MKATEKAAAERRTAAKQALRKIKGQKAVVPEYREGAPLPPGDESFLPEPQGQFVSAASDDHDPYATHPVVFSAPVGTALEIGSMVSRLDFAHENIGVITDLDTSAASTASGALAYVMFNDEESGWLNASISAELRQ